MLNLVNAKIPVITSLNYASYQAVLLSLLFWILKYQIIRLMLRSKSPEYCCRVLTLIHSGAVTALGVNECFVENATVFDHPEGATTDPQKMLLVLSLGYFIHDLVWCAFYQTETKLMVVHHIFAVAYLLRMLFKRCSGAQATCCLACMEVTNPLLQCRWLLRSEGFYPSCIFTTVELIFMALFVVVRVIFGSFVVLRVLSHPNSCWDVRVFVLSFYIISWMFMIEIVNFLLKKYRKSTIVLQLRESPNKDA